MNAMEHVLPTFTAAVSAHDPLSGTEGYGGSTQRRLRRILMRMTEVGSPCPPWFAHCLPFGEQGSQFSLYRGLLWTKMMWRRRPVVL